ncbi:MAG TPA: cupredoxin domain-containing protein, partial [Nevskiaceae bacterium]|nr:cupredoxin domain-containing protein [Nevskiaceae bacterium]
MRFPRPRTLRLLVAALLAAGAVLLGTALPALAGDAPSTTVERAASRAAAVPIPVFELVEGAKGSPYPYTPRSLTIPAGRNVALRITDHIGGCALVTDFPHLGPNGSTVQARVPVGQTRTVMIRAPKPGHYRYHCSGNMYFGVIVA